MKMTINNKEFNGHYEIVSAYALITSHNEKNFAAVSKKKKKNDRDYSKDKAAQDMVIRMSLNFDDRAYREFPIVKKQNGKYFVVSGNNRVMSYKRAARFNAYLDALKTDLLYETNIEKPMKVFVLDTNEPLDTKMMSFFNHSDKKEMSTIEKSISISKILNAESLEKLNAYIDGFETLSDFYVNRKCLNLFTYLVDNDILNEMEVGKYRDLTAGITNEGKTFLECLFMGSMFSDECIRLLASDGMKALMNKFIKASLIFSTNRNAGAYSIIPLIEKAIFTIKQAQNAGLSVENFLASQDFFADPIPSVIPAIIEKIQLTQKEFKEFFGRVIDCLNTTNSNGVDLVLGYKETFSEIIARFFQCEYKEETPAETENETETVEETPAKEERAIDRFIVDCELYLKKALAEPHNEIEEELVAMARRGVKLQNQYLSAFVYDKISDIEIESEYDRLYALYEYWGGKFQNADFDYHGFISAFPKEMWEDFIF